MANAAVQGRRRRRAWALAALAAASALSACDCAGVEPLPDGGDAGEPAAESEVVFALAGPDLVALEGSRVQLDGHASRALDGTAALSWSQVDGPQVLLTTPSGPAPAFIAPLAPSSLRFRLRATSKGMSAFDEVTVRVVGDNGPLPVLAEVPGDTATALPSTEETFDIQQRGDIAMNVTWSARALCAGGQVAVAESVVEVALPDVLPCAVRVDGVTADGRRVAPALRVFWPEGTAAALDTDLDATGFTLDPGESATVSFAASSSADELRLWEATGLGRVLGATVEGGPASFEAPREATRLLFGGERRRGSFSGGIRYLVLDVTAGPGNRAPSVDPGPDRTTVPGGLFSLAVTADDVDDDPLAIQILQVLGESATAVTDQLFQAPDTEGVLLFHVAAFDGTVLSPPASVRVRVDPASPNQPPVLNLDETVYVAPGRTFVIDASSATDDSGFLDHFVIAQDPEDAVILLPEPFEVDTAAQAQLALVALSDGDLYHFRVSVFDALGASASQEVTVHVENAGPWIDPQRGDDDTGNGTEATPFASLTGALDTAIRHRLASLYVAGEAQLPFTGALPSGLVLEGGFAWSGSAYAPASVRPTLPVADGGAVVEDSELRHLEVFLGNPAASLALAGSAVLADVHVSEGPLHTGSVVVVRSGAEVEIRDSLLSGGTTSEDTQVLVDVEPSALVRLLDTSVTPGPGPTRIGLRCEQAALDVLGGLLLGSTQAEVALAIEADSCDLQLVGAQVAGGIGVQEAVGLQASFSAVRVDEDSVVVGLTGGAGQRAAAIELLAGDGSVQLDGRLVAVQPPGVAEVATGVYLGSDRAELVALEVAAEATTRAEAVTLDADEVLVRVGTLSARSLEGEARGFSYVSGLAPRVEGGTGVVEAAAARGFVRDGELPPHGVTLQDVFLSLVGTTDAVGIGLGAATDVTLLRTVVEISAGAGSTPSRGLTLGAGTVSDSAVRVVGDGDVLGLVVAVAEGGALVERSTVSATSNAGDAVGVRIAGPTELRSVLVRSSGTTAAAVEARAPAVLRHVTVLSSSGGVVLDSASASVDVANSLLRAEPALRQSVGAGPLLGAAGCAFDATVAFEDASGGQITDPGALLALPCPGCVFTDSTGVVDDTGHLQAGATDLIDRAISAYAHPLDIDGDTRPQGVAPDIGCDEYVP